LKKVNPTLFGGWKGSFGLCQRSKAHIFLNGSMPDSAASTALFGLFYPKSLQHEMKLPESFEGKKKTIKYDGCH